MFADSSKISVIGVVKTKGVIFIPSCVPLINSFQAPDLNMPAIFILSPNANNEDDEIVTTMTPPIITNKLIFELDAPLNNPIDEVTL